MADINDLLVRIDATTEQLRRELKRAEQAVDTGSKRIDGAAKRIDRSFAMMNRAAVRLAGAFGIAFGVRGLVRHISAQLEAADSMLKLTERIGGTTEALSELQHVANLSGVTWNQMTMGLQRMTRRIAEAAQGMGEARGALRELGLDATTLSRLPLDRQFELIADRLSGVKSESDRVRLAMKLFDSAGVALLQTMTRGAEGIRQMREEARRLGITLSREQGEAAAKARDEIERMRSSVNALSRDLILGLAPAISQAAEGLREMFFGVTPTNQLRTLDEVGERFRQRFYELMALQEQIKDFESRRRVVGRDPLGNPMFKASDQVQYNRLLQEERRIQTELNALMERRAQLEEQARNQRNEALIAPMTDAERNARRAMEEFFGRFGKMSVDQLKRARPRIELDEIFVSDDTDLQRQALRLTERFKSELERAEEDVKLAEALFERGLISDETLKRTREQLESLSKDMNDSFRSFGLSMGRAIEDTFADAFMGIETNFGEMLRRMAIRAATSQLFSTLATLGGPVGQFASFLGFGGNRASGGEISPGRFYMVGERGPELIAPRSAGTVIPNHKLGGLSINVDARGAHDPVAVEQAVERGVRAAVQISGAQTQAMIGQLFRPAMA